MQGIRGTGPGVRISTRSNFIADLRGAPGGDRAASNLAVEGREGLGGEPGEHLGALGAQLGDRVAPGHLQADPLKACRLQERAILAHGQGSGEAGRPAQRRARLALTDRQVAQFAIEDDVGDGETPARLEHAEGVVQHLALIGGEVDHAVREDALAGIMGKEAWWSAPAGVVLGVPLYSNVAGVIPVVDALMAKGAAMGAMLAFMMAVVALSLPEIIILRRVLKPRLIATFVGVVAAGIIAIGYLFNLVI